MVKSHDTIICTMMSSIVMRYLHQSLFINHRVWSNKTSLMPPLFIEVPVPGPLSETVMHLCIMGIDVASFLDCSIGFWNCSDSVVFLVFHFVCMIYSWYKASLYPIRHPPSWE